MFLKGILGEGPGGLGHDPVPGDLGDDGGRGDGAAEGVPVNDGLLEPGPGGGETAVYQGKLGLRLEGLKGLGHGPETRLKDPYLVYDLTFHPGHRPGDGLPGDDLVKFFPFFGAQALGVSQLRVVKILREDDRRRHHRPGQGPPADLVHPGYVAVNP